MLRKLWKILWISVASFIALFILLAIIGHIIGPPKTLKEEPVTTEPTAPADPSPPIEYKIVDWTQTPEEQELKVGDWIAARGQADGLVGAFRKFKGHLSELGSIDPLSGDYYFETLRNDRVQVFELNYGEAGSIGLIPLPSPLPAEIKIRSIVVFSIPNPAQHPVLGPYNQLRLHGLKEVTDIVIGGKISRITAAEEKDGHLRQALWLEDRGATFQLTATPDEIDSAMEQAKANASAVVEKYEQLHSQFSAWHGGHKKTTAYIKNRMHNPKSFEHVRTLHSTNQEEGYRIITMTYRGTNIYNAVVTNTVQVKVDLNGNVMGVISNQ